MEIPGWVSEGMDGNCLDDQCTGFAVSSNVSWDLDDVSEQDNTWGEF